MEEQDPPPAPLVPDPEMLTEHDWGSGVALGLVVLILMAGVGTALVTWMRGW